ncbi:MAG: AAA family ATPase [Pseudonocardiaceae bacterium]
MATWHPGPEDLRRVFAEQNPWHRTGTVPDVLARPRERPLARGLSDRIADSAAPRRFQLVLGPRRVGKTTAMYQAARRLLASGIPPERVWWLRMDHPLLLRESLGDLVRQICDASGGGAEQSSVLLLDELVYARDWDLWLKTFYDDQWQVRVIATSSATAAPRHHYLGDRRQESGVGPVVRTVPPAVPVHRVSGSGGSRRPVRRG